MARRVRLDDVCRGLTVGAAVLLTLVLAALLPSPGFTTLRLAYFALVVVVAWIGAVGAISRRPRLLVGGGVALVVLGAWQFTIGLVMVPTAAVYLVTAMVLHDQSS